MVSYAGSASCAVEVAGITFLLPKWWCVIKLHCVPLAEQSGINQQEEAIKGVKHSNGKLSWTDFYFCFYLAEIGSETAPRVSAELPEE